MRHVSHPGEAYRARAPRRAPVWRPSCILCGAVELIAAFVYVLAVYIAIPMYFLGGSPRQAEPTDGAAPIRRRGRERIQRELERRRQGLIDADGPDRMSERKTADM